MTDHIRFNVYVTAKEGRLDELKQIAKDWSAYMKKERPDVLSYQWFFASDDETKVQVMEVYESSEAMLATMEQTSDSGETDYPYVMTKLEVCGNVSDALRAKLDAGDSPIEYWNHIDGFTR
jgi:quinol monooxygenase YgiN